MIPLSPYLAHIDDYDWCYLYGEEGRDDVIRWKTLTGAPNTDTRGISFGVCEVPPDAKLNPHRHANHEVYYVYQGAGEVLLNKEVVAVQVGSVLFVPGNLAHGIRNYSDQTLGLMWMFPTDKWEEVAYQMLDQTF